MGKDDEDTNKEAIGSLKSDDEGPDVKDDSFEFEKPIKVET